MSATDLWVSFLLIFGVLGVFFIVLIAVALKSFLEGLRLFGFDYYLSRERSELRIPSLRYAELLARRGSRIADVLEEKKIGKSSDLALVREALPTFQSLVHDGVKACFYKSVQDVSSAMKRLQRASSGSDREKLTMLMRDVRQFKWAVMVFADR